MSEFWRKTMKKPELLVPAGNMECLKQAVLNGCDAVYLACKSFGARKFAMNFTNDEIIEAISFCHLYGVRVYVTMNTLIKNSEVDAFLEQASFLHKNGVDALIVQDFGMICLLRETFPNLEIHASTQANISSSDICKLYHDIGVKRVVFSRELSIDEIDSINVDIEKEVFIHGALCISYSGCCLMSSMLGGRSGNRGECAGVCRMPFTLLKNNTPIKENEYLLSTKELNTSHNIKRLLESSIDSFKIEGRMKGPLYVGFITRYYRSLIDGEKFSFEKENQLKTIFNRDFTNGRLFNATDKELMNPKTPNHVGLEIGKVISFNKNKIKIKLFPNSTLHQGDAIRFLNSEEGFIVNYLYDEKGKLTSSSNSICFVDNKINLSQLDTVSKTQDYLLEKDFKTFPNKKVPITFKVIARSKKPLQIIIKDDKYTFVEDGDILEKAINSPTTKEDINRQLSKLGDTPFICHEINIDMDEELFIPLGYLNSLRRKLTEKLISARTSIKNNYQKNDVVFSTNNDNTDLGRIHCYISNEEQLKVCLKNKVDVIYTSKENLYEKYKEKGNIYYFLPKCLISPNTSCRENNVVSDYAKYSSKNTIGSYELNVMNIYTAYYLNKIGISKICLSTELSEDEYNEFINKYREKFGNKTFIILTYGRVQNMIIKGNILELPVNDTNYYLQDSRKRLFPLYYDGRLTHILNHEKKDVNNQLENITKRLDFYEESPEEIESILQRLQ